MKFNLFDWLGAVLSKLFTAAVPESLKIFKLFISTFEQAAVNAVIAEARKTISGEQKFENAVANVQAIVLAAGWKASQTALETLVQDAYTGWKASQGDHLVSAP